MISIKSKKEIEAMREGGKILAEVMARLFESVRPGVSTYELDEKAEKLIQAKGGVPAFKGYGKEMGHPFPGTLCVSLNDEVVHGLPAKKKIMKSGDLLKIDVGMVYQGFNTDMARTVAVGEVTPEARKLMEVAEEAFWQGIKCLKEGENLSEYSRRAQQYVEANGFSVVRNLVGHGIGRELHEDPQIPNYFNKKYSDTKLKAGMTLALEPMVNAGGFETKLAHDGWTFKTKDGSLSAHYENTILITKKGVEVLTV